MAEPIGVLRVDLSANAARFSQDMGRAQKAVKRSSTNMTRNMERFTRAANSNVSSLTRLSTVATSLTRVLPGIGAALSVAGIVNFTKDTIRSTAAWGRFWVP